MRTNRNVETTLERNPQYAKVAEAAGICERFEIIFRNMPIWRNGTKYLNSLETKNAICQYGGTDPDLEIWLI